jgi:hypothetical protein
MSVDEMRRAADAMKEDAGVATTDTNTHIDEDAAGRTSDSPRLGVSSSTAAGVAATTRTRLSPRARRRLTQFLIGKSIIEALFIGALACWAAYQTFPPFFRGSLDAADNGTVAGWAVDASAPAARVELQLYVDGHFAGRGQADQSRPDVVAAKRAQDEFHGFKLKLPPLPPGAHEARIYAVHASGAGQRITLQQLDKAVRFSVPASATNASVPVRWWETMGQP